MINLINSIWEITKSNGTVMHITLLDKGYFEYINIEGANVDITYGGIGSNETWKIDGESITLSFNNGFMIKSGKIISSIYVDNQLITECELLASVVNRYE